MITPLGRSPFLLTTAEGSKLYYVKMSQHFHLEPTRWEGDGKHDTTLGENAVRWRYTGIDKKQKESNARIVKWEDGSMTVHVGKDVLQMNQSTLPPNLHHLFAKQMASDGQPIIEAQGIMTSKLAFKTGAGSSLGKKMFHNISRIGKQKVDRSDVVVKQALDEDEQVNIANPIVWKSISMRTSR